MTETYVWTVLEQNEDGDIEPWATSFRSQESAMKQVELNSKQFTYPDIEGQPIHFLPIGNDQIVACSVDPNASWPSWTITRTELED